MDQQLFLVTYDQPNFQYTVLTPEWEEEELLNEIPELDSITNNTRIWGVREGPGNSDTYENMEPGDWLLFYNRGEYKHAGKVGEKFRNEILFQEYWIEGTTASMLYTVEEFSDIELSRRKLNNILGYKKRGKTEWHPQGVHQVEEKKQKKIIDEYDSMENFITELIEKGEEEPWWKK